MNLKRILTFTLILSLSSVAFSQLNQTDRNGKRQGHWIRNYPNGKPMYDGTFRDNHPVGEFRRFDEDGTLRSVLIFSEDGKTSDATIYHPNGRIASRGRYIDQKKEGVWQFYSADTEGYRISEENYEGNLRNGSSMKFYPDSSLAELTTYRNDVKHGHWEQYYKSGKTLVKSNYVNGKLTGSYEAWFEDGKPMYTGQYNADVREGLWHIYNEDGSVKYRIEYKNGVPDNRQMDIDASKHIDSLEKQKGNIPDPEKTGEMW